MASEPLFLSDEWWGSCGPDWDSLISYKALVESFGLTVREWRMHPAPYAAMMADLTVGPLNFTDPYSTQRTALGASLVLDSTLEESRCRVCVRAEALTFKPAARPEEKPDA